jgi:protein-serine/threonine kinase
MKPENVILDRYGHLKLTDFGISKMYAGGRLTKTFCGTTEYLAPEVVNFQGHNRAVDWWGLGIMAYEALSGKSPFVTKEGKRRNQFETFQAISKVTCVILNTT